MSFTAFSQPYKNAIGIRFGSEYIALTGKHYLHKTDAIEVMVNGSHDGIGFCGLYERYIDLKDVKNLYFYYGGGGHAAFSNKEYWIGCDGVVGFDYTFEAAPINLSIDWKPAVNIVKHLGRSLFDIGLSARFSF